MKTIKIKQQSLASFKHDKQVIGITQQELNEIRT